jgi:hypothetical protein
VPEHADDVVGRVGGLTFLFGSRHLDDTLVARGVRHNADGVERHGDGLQDLPQGSRPFTPSLCSCTTMSAMSRDVSSSTWRSPRIGNAAQ